MQHTPTLLGWRDHPLRNHLERRFGVVCVVDNDANAMALGEYHTEQPASLPLLFVKGATGIGVGVVVDGHALCGADGAEGDLEHVRIASAEDGPLCVCEARGCLVASASGRALARALREQGEDAPDSRSVVELALAGRAEATRLVREAGLVIGDVLATAVSLLNPRVLALGGDLVLVQGTLHRRRPRAALPVHAAAGGARPARGGQQPRRAGRRGRRGPAGLEEVFCAEAVDRALAGRR